LYPYISQSATGVPIGFDVDLMNSIASITGLSFTYEFQQFSQLIASVQNDTNTISISAEIDTSAREQSVNFAEFTRTATGFIVKSTYNQTINGLSDLCGKIVAVLSGSVQINDAMNQNAKCGGNNITIQIWSTFTEIANAVQSGSANVGLSPEPVLSSFASQSNGQLIVVGQAYDFNTIGILCNKENQALCCLLVNAINYLIKQGTYEQLLNKYSFTYQKYGICPSTINLNQTCLSTCAPTNSFCQNKLG
jgi:polar amino acid transport system substrate-binding protein